MDEQNSETQQSQRDTEALSFAEFLESTPPGQLVDIAPLIVRHNHPSRGGFYYTLEIPDLQLHCSSESCNGLRFFRFLGDERGPVLRNNDDNLFYVKYKCSNCRETVKVFSLMAIADEETLNGKCFKIGELPIYGPPTPARLITLIGPDRDIFLKGRRCENEGLGIGAFVYYRRVVENQKSRILGQIIKVAEKLKAPKESINALVGAQKETQFSKALASVKDALPQSLLINGQNPMTLLHSALSEGLHGQTDEYCLETAQAVRVVLAELSDRLGQALKDEAELNQALSRLTKRPAPDNNTSPET